jgi:beta-xylosidase
MNHYWVVDIIARHGDWLGSPLRGNILPLVHRFSTPYSHSGWTRAHLDTTHGSWSGTCCFLVEKLLSARETNYNSVRLDKSEKSPPSKVSLALAISLAVLGSSAALGADVPLAKPLTPSGTYLNPIGDPPIHLQEPFILVYAKKYYLLGTTSPSEGFQCYESPDLAHWKFDGWAWRKSGLHVARGDLHSPQVFVYQGMFCMVYSGRMPTGTQLALAASVKPEGPYHDLHVPWLGLGNGCVGGDVFIDDNGKPYLIFSQKSTRNSCSYSAIYGVALNKDLSKIIGEPAKLLEANQRWELVHGDLNQCNESARMFRIGSKYYLAYSANDHLTSDYGIGYALADKPLGPWTKSTENPLLSSHAEIGVFGPGRGSVFRSVDRSEWFIAYDSLTDPANRSEDRVVNIDRLVLQNNRTLTTKGPTRSPQQLPSGAK